jgi:aldose sugar dehydrogenase
MMRMLVRSFAWLSLAAACSLAASGCQRGQADRPDPDETHSSQLHAFSIETLAEDLEHPWGLALLPGGDDALVTERPGRLQRVVLATGEKTRIRGIPEVRASGQGGLLDVALHPAFEDNAWVYLTYAAAGPDGSGAATYLGRGRLEGDALADFEVLFAAEPYVSGGRHFGSRIAFDEEGYLFMTVGDRGERDRSQERSNAIGATLRLTDDGDIPPDNPFVGEDDAEPAIYSLGHRNVQAMAFHPDSGALWQIEHGPRGGDEINLPAKGQNFGWPLTSYGVEYGSRRDIGPDPHEHEGTVPPIHYWEESFAPSGAAFYSGDAFPQWRGDLFVGSLAREHLARLSIDGETIVAEEPLLEDFSWRIRDVRAGSDGFLYLLIDAKDSLLVRLVPAG